MTGKPCSDEVCETMDTCATGKACYPDLAPPTKPCTHSLDECDAVAMKLCTLCTIDSLRKENAELRRRLK